MVKRRNCRSQHVKTPSGPSPPLPQVNACDAPVYTTHWIDGGTLSLNENSGTLPSGPSPAVSATDVDVDVTLAWQPGAANTPCGDAASQYRVYFGTGIDPPWVATLAGPSTTYDPGKLQPETTYSWRVEVVHGGYALSSPLWFFTTGGSVSLESTNWSTIKSLYDSRQRDSQWRSP